MIKSVEHLDSALAVADNETICDGVKVIEKIICFHGGEYKSSNLKEELKKIIEKGYKS
jgi:hypothetical protein